MRVAAESRITCQRCRKPISGDPVRISLRQSLSSPLTILRLICADCAHNFSQWWYGKATA